MHAGIAKQMKAADENMKSPKLIVPNEIQAL